MSNTVGFEFSILNDVTSLQEKVSKQEKTCTELSDDLKISINKCMLGKEAISRLRSSINKERKKLHSSQRILTDLVDRLTFDFRKYNILKNQTTGTSNTIEKLKEQRRKKMTLWNTQLELLQSSYYSSNFMKIQMGIKKKTVELKKKVSILQQQDNDRKQLFQSFKEYRCLKSRLEHLHVKENSILEKITGILNINKLKEAIENKKNELLTLQRDNDNIDDHILSIIDDIVSTSSANHQSPPQKLQRTSVSFNALYFSSDSETML
ncbi:hypothetical protein PCE1_000116 [Barthelona sp. PCE]